MDTVRADYFQVLLDVGRRGAACDVGAGATWRPDRISMPVRTPREPFVDWGVVPLLYAASAVSA
jgi:hypothetical protein